MSYAAHCGSQLTSRGNECQYMLFFQREAAIFLASNPAR